MMDVPIDGSPGHGSPTIDGVITIGPQPLDAHAIDRLITDPPAALSSSSLLSCLSDSRTIESFLLLIRFI